MTFSTRGAPRFGAVVRRGLTGAPTNLGLAALSLLIAVVLWVVVTNNENPSVSQFRDVRLEAVNVPRNYIASGLTPDRARVEVVGTRSALNDLRIDDLVARVDLSQVVDDSASAGREFTVDASVRVDVHRRRVRAESQIPTASVTLEQIERRPVQVQVTRVGALPVGYELDSLTSDPAEVTVVGARRNLASVELVSADIKLDSLTVPVTTTVTLEARDREGRTIGGVRVEPATATVRAALHQTLFAKQVLVNAPVRGRPRTGYQVRQIATDPPTVNIVGPLDQVNKLTGISTDFVDIEGADRDVVRSVQLLLPSGVTASQQSVVATVGLQVVRAPGSLAATPRIVNVGPGLTAQPSTSVIAVNVSGPLGDVVGLRPTDVSVTVDVAGLTAGMHRVEPRVTVSAPTIQVEAVVPDKIEVVITPIR